LIRNSTLLKHSRELSGGVRQ